MRENAARVRTAGPARRRTFRLDGARWNRPAAELLAAGDPTADVVAKLDYFDEPHLARALRCYVGRTVRQLREGAGGAIALDPGQRATS